MIDKLEELEGLSFAVGEFYTTKQEDKDRLKQLRKEINQSLKLTELVKEEIKIRDSNLTKAGFLIPETLIILQSLVYQSENSGDKID